MTASNLKYWLALQRADTPTKVNRVSLEPLSQIRVHRSRPLGSHKTTLPVAKRISITSSSSSSTAKRFDITREETMKKSSILRFYTESHSGRGWVNECVLMFRETFRWIGVI